jgi:hypothetical protein
VVAEAGRYAAPAMPPPAPGGRSSPSFGAFLSTILSSPGGSRQLRFAARSWVAPAADAGQQTLVVPRRAAFAPDISAGRPLPPWP